MKIQNKAIINISLLIIIFSLVINFIFYIFKESQIHTIKEVAQNNDNNTLLNQHSNYVNSINLIGDNLNNQADIALQAMKSAIAKQGNANLDYQYLPVKAVDIYSMNLKEVFIPILQIGKVQYRNNEDFNRFIPVIDEIGRNYKINTSIFVRLNEEGDMYLISTNIQNYDGQRAIDQLIPAKINQEVNILTNTIFTGQVYKGVLRLNSEYHYAHFERIINKRGRIIGMYGVSINLTDYYSTTKHDNIKFLSFSTDEYNFGSEKPFSSSRNIVKEVRMQDTSGKFFIKNRIMNFENEQLNPLQMNYIYDNIKTEPILINSAVSVYDRFGVALVSLQTPKDTSKEIARISQYYLISIISLWFFTVILLLFSRYIVYNKFNEINNIFKNITEYLKHLQSSNKSAHKYIEETFSIQLNDGTVTKVNAPQESADTIIEALKTGIIIENNYIKFKRRINEQELEIKNLSENYKNAKLEINQLNSNLNDKILEINNQTSIITTTLNELNNEHKAIENYLSNSALKIELIQFEKLNQINNFIEIHISNMTNILYKFQQLENLNKSLTCLIDDAEIMAVNASVQKERTKDTGTNLYLLEKELIKFSTQNAILSKEIDFVTDESSKFLNGKINDLILFNKSIKQSIDNYSFNIHKNNLSNNLKRIDLLNSKLENDTSSLNDKSKQLSKILQ